MDYWNRIPEDNSCIYILLFNDMFFLLIISLNKDTDETYRNIARTVYL